MVANVDLTFEFDSENISSPLHILALEESKLLMDAAWDYANRKSIQKSGINYSR